MADVAEAKKRALAAVVEWFNERGLARTQRRARKPTEGRMREEKAGEASRTAVCVGLLLCRRLREKYPLEEKDLDTGGGQVPGLSGANVQRILKDHGIEKKYSSMGGRTTRSSTPVAKALIDKLEKHAGLRSLRDEERIKVASAIEDWLVDKVKAYFARKKLEVEIDLSKPGPVIVEDILRVSHEKKIGGPVAQHLVGAKLARRFPDKVIENYPSTAPDEQLNREADFLVENAAFHVSVVPTSDHMHRCAENLVQGRQPYIVVPAAQVSKARAFAEDKKIEGKVAIVAIETFVGQNIDEMGEFRRGKVKPEMTALLNEYNRRVAEVETDQSIQISIPKHLTED
ncbi:MAG: DUF4928 family protein [Bryobacterales bacterium]|nr:DUF4928 family protein [Bryobacterales bacterium]